MATNGLSTAGEAGQTGGAGRSIQRRLHPLLHILAAHPRARTAGKAAAAAFLMATGTATAEVKRDESGWLCGSPQDWEVASLVIAPKLILNNFFFEETGFRGKSMKVLRVSFSILNKGSDSHIMSGQYAGFDRAGSLAFAFSSHPGAFDGFRGASGLRTATGSVFVSKWSLAKTAKICAAFSVGGS